MFDRIFANFLVDTGRLTLKNLGDIYSCQEQKRVRLGVIAVSEKLMSIEQVEEVNQLQAIYDKRFGDIAVEKGYLTEEQVSRLLVLQGNAFLAFMQSIVDEKYMTMTEVSEALDEYQKANAFTLMNMEDLKSCDVDRIIPIFIYEQPEMVQKLCGVMLRTMSRLIDYHVYIKKPYITNEYQFPAICLQELNGEHKIVTAIAGELEDALKEAAIGFAGSENISDDDDVLDALCELINCVNGLLATDMSNKSVDIDMAAPYAQKESGTIKSDSILCLPIVIYGQTLDLLVQLDKDYTI